MGKNKIPMHKGIVCVYFLLSILTYGDFSIYPYTILYKMGILLMREKYIIKKLSGDAVLGIRWDVKKQELLIGGPARFVGELEDLEVVFEVVSTLESVQRGSRFENRYLVTAENWEEGLERLEWTKKRVMSFRRLMQ